MRIEVQAVLNKLKVIEKKVEGFLVNAQDNEEREERLQTELDAIQEAIGALENIE